MWPKSYKDYPVDASLVKYEAEPGRGIIGCEMHDLNGWGERHHIPKKRKKGIISTLLSSLFGTKK